MGMNNRIDEAKRVDEAAGGNQRERINPCEIVSGSMRVRVSYAGECSIGEAVCHFLASKVNCSEATHR